MSCGLAAFDTAWTSPEAWRRLIGVDASPMKLAVVMGDEVLGFLRQPNLHAHVIYTYAAV